MAAPPEKKTVKKVMRSQAREVIAAVYKRMKYEAENGVERKTDARWRTAQAVGVSERTVSRILKQKREHDATGAPFKSPHTNKTPRKCLRRDIEAIDRAEIRRTINNFQRKRKKNASLKSLKKVLNKKINFTGCIETLRRIILDLGYEWKTTDDNRRMLAEKHEVQMLRYKYLRQLQKYREDGRYIIYTDESYVDSSPVQPPVQQWSNEAGPIAQKKPSNNGIRVMMVHAGGKNGFVPNACLIYKANSTTGDYHNNMNNDNYMKWFREQLLPNIPQKAVVVLDNAAYHNAHTEKVPTFNSSKAEMQAWLTYKNIEFHVNMKRIELFDIILRHKDESRNFALDALARQYGCDVLRLPPHHPDLNPLEKVWGELRAYVAGNHFDHNYTTVLNLISERMYVMDQTFWMNLCRQVEETEKKYWKDYDAEQLYAMYVDEEDSDTDVDV